MGQQSSSSKSDSAASLNYYEILEVEETATADEIKKAFRKRALKEHPDKNPDDVEGATQRFATLQQAYEVLSDEQERAWYDSHKSSLAPEPDDATVYEDIRKGSAPTRPQGPGLTVRHLSRFFDMSISSGFDDGENSFFTVYRNLFARLQAEEGLISDVDYPSFGYAAWSWVPANKTTDGARAFYAAWMNFATAKEFAWMDQWNLAEAPDRRMRRLMEKDNKKAREDARREYNDTIRSLAKFLRKRDPRYKTHLAQTAASGSATPVAAPRQTAPVRAEYVEQEWQRVDALRTHEDLEWAAGEGEDLEEWECVVCGKSFWSEAAWDSHERSKKHLREVERLKREMLQDNIELGLGEEEEAEEEIAPPPASPPPISREPSPPAQDDEEPHLRPNTKKKKTKGDLASTTSSEPLTKTERMARSLAEPDSGEERNSPAPTAPTKRDLRRARQAKKAETGRQLRCNVCSETFEDKNMLFAHVREAGHASAEPPERGKKGNKGKK
ncbi:hypothetical protein FB45DRAFT_887971 [Roridomyces roridus]|uniref:DnaJ-domain-containing protein n=1 Tax=Roridomyces roridus TaxID=1738132 RepID=A0AAD7G173_9AGAR|nr:hypothetical protein FB45DRAFT_887971 [Roridomyces roridus]